MILCECGELIEGATFEDYIKTSLNPSTRAIGHQKCGMMFNFVDNGMPKRYSSKKELKVLATRFAEKNNIDEEIIGIFLLEVDRLKSNGNLTDNEIILVAYKKAIKRK